ncbi:MAG: methyltransferase domain-containing protein [Acidimicrobiia bacterium]
MEESEASAARVDELVLALQARVEERRRSGAYPPGLEHELDAHYQRIVSMRGSRSSFRERLDAVHETTDAFAADAIPLRSRVPGGARLHRIVAKVVRRQTEGVIAQARANARAVADALEAAADPLEMTNEAPGGGLRGQLDALQTLVADQQRALNLLRADLLAVIERRIRVPRGQYPDRPAFEPWFENDRFEAAFRGGRAELLERYRDLAARLSGCGPVLDVGFGRGEFLELLGELGVEARGVETDPLLVKRAEELGLDVALDDGNTYLRQLEDGSLGGLTLIQVIEHLNPQDALDLVPVAARKVRPGGKVIIETVNPQSLYVFARSFYLDPTHVRPVHPAYLEFLFREAGFAEVEIDWRNPPPDTEQLLPLAGEDESTRELNENFARLSSLMFAPQDYAIIATR